MIGAEDEIVKKVSWAVWWPRSDLLEKVLLGNAVTGFEWRRLGYVFNTIVVVMIPLLPSIERSLEYADHKQFVCMQAVYCLFDLRPDRCVGCSQKGTVITIEFLHAPFISRGRLLSLPAIGCHPRSPGRIDEPAVRCRQHLAAQAANKRTSTSPIGIAYEYVVVAGSISVAISGAVHRFDDKLNPYLLPMAPYCFGNIHLAQILPVCRRNDKRGSIRAKAPSILPVPLKAQAVQNLICPRRIVFGETMELRAFSMIGRPVGR